MNDIVRPKKQITTNSQTVSHNRTETLKTVLIAMMVTAVASFLFGMHVANQNNADKQQAVHTALLQLK